MTDSTKGAEFCISNSNDSNTTLLGSTRMLDLPQERKTSPLRPSVPHGKNIWPSEGLQVTDSKIPAFFPHPFLFLEEKIISEVLAPELRNEGKKATYVVSGSLNKK